jgi:siroheme synthase-like protein
VTGYPLLLEGSAIHALVVGGGRVAARKASALLDAGASVRVVAPRVGDELRIAATRHGARLRLLEREYEPGDLGAATLVVAATERRDVNARVAADARAAHRLVNVADAPAEGNCATVAAHRAGRLVVGVSAGGVPNAAARIRDAIARRFDGRYAGALQALGELRARLLGAGDRAAWRRAVASLVAEDFCASVESGAFAERVAQWR